MADDRNLKGIFLSNQGRQIDRWLHYFDIYEKHFSKFRQQKITIVEIGVQHGGSLAMWRDYFGNRKILIVNLNG